MNYYVNVKIPAGFPSPALDYMESRTTLDELYVKDLLSTFIIDAEGDSMINSIITRYLRSVLPNYLPTTFLKPHLGNGRNYQRLGK